MLFLFSVFPSPLSLPPMSFLSSSFALSSHLYLQPLRYVSSFSSSYSLAHTLSLFIRVKWFLFFSWSFLSASQPRANLIFICLIGGTPVSPHFVDSSLFFRSVCFFLYRGRSQPSFFGKAFSRVAPAANARSVDKYGDFRRSGGSTQRDLACRAAQHRVYRPWSF